MTESFREAEVTMDISCEENARSKEEVDFPITGFRGKDQFEFVIKIVKMCEVVTEVIERYPVVISD